MVVTTLTKDEAQQLGLPDILRRVEAGEEIRITESGRTRTIPSASNNAPLDSSLDATIARFEQWEREHGERLTLGRDFADDLERRVAMRKSRDTSEWE